MDTLQAVAHCEVMQSAPGNHAPNPPLVSIVDDDESIRESLPDLLRQLGFASRTFASAEEFLSTDFADETSCLILDVAMPGMDGPELHRELKRRGKKIPVIFVTGQRDETIRTRLLQQGAAGFLLKPFSDADLVAAIETALNAG
jgi:FixJ family two-component response regulator